jgi:ribonuclease BN (tRNA processing enzyme)
MSDTTRTPDDIRKDIEHTREELADTAAALAEKADVKARAHEKVEETKARAHVKVDETKAKVSHRVEDAKADPVKPGILIAAGVGGVVVAWLVLRRR